MSAGGHNVLSFRRSEYGYGDVAIVKGMIGMVLAGELCRGNVSVVVDCGGWKMLSLRPSDVRVVGAAEFTRKHQLRRSRDGRLIWRRHEDHQLMCGLAAADARLQARTA